MNVKRCLCAVSAGFALALWTQFAQGQSWEDITAHVPVPLSAQNHRSIETDGQRLYVLGNTGVYVSANDGASFQPLNTVQDAVYSLTNLAQRFIKHVNGQMWVGCDPGSAAINLGHATLHRLVPGQTVWQKSSSGFPVGTTDNQADDLAYDAATGTYFAAAALGGVFVSTNGADWERRSTGLGGLGVPATVVAYEGLAFVLRPMASVYRTSNQGQSWTALNSHPGPGGGFLVRHGGRLLFATTGNNQMEEGVYYSDDNGNTWKFHQGLKGGVMDIASDGQLLFAAGRYGYLGADGFKFSATDGLTWDRLPTNGLPPAFSASRIERLGNYLFMHVPGLQKLYRLNLAGVDFTPSTQIAHQPEATVNRYGGETFTLSVVAGGSQLSYQWQRNGVEVPGATSAAYTVAAAGTNDSGSYRVVVRGSRGVVTSAVAAVTVVLREEGRNDPTYPSLNVGGQLRILPNGELLAFNNNRFYRYSSEGQLLASRTVNGVTTFTGFTLLDSSNRVLLVSSSPYRLWRIAPDTLANDAEFNQLAANGNIRTVVEWPGRGYWVGGDFTAVTNAGVSTNAAWYLALINYAGVVETAFHYLTNGPNGSIYNVVVDSGTNVYVHGAFTAWADIQLYQQSGLVKLRPDFTRDAGFNPAASLRDGTTKFFPLGPGRILALVGNNIPQPVMMAADGTVDSTYNAANYNFSSYVYGLAPGEGGKVYLGGNFNRFGTNYNAGYLRLTSDGVVDMAFYNNTGSGKISSLVYDPRGFLYYTRSQNPYGPFRLFAGISQAASTGSFADWVAQFGLAQGMQGAGDDADHDGIPNLFEYYFGSSPTNAASGQRPAAAYVPMDGQNYPAITFERQKDVSGVTLSSQVSATLTFGQVLGALVETVVDLGNGKERVTLRSPVSAAVQPVQFLRIRLAMP